MFKVRNVINFRPEVLEELNLCVTNLGLENLRPDAIILALAKKAISSSSPETKDLEALKTELNELRAENERLKAQLDNHPNHPNQGIQDCFYDFEWAMIEKCAQRMNYDQPVKVLRELFIRQAIEGPGDHLPYLFNKRDYLIKLKQRKNGLD